MKYILTLSICLTMFSAMAQNENRMSRAVKVYFNEKQYYMFEDLNANKKLFTLISDTLFIHKKIPQYDIKEAVHELRYLYFKGKTYRYSISFYDQGYLLTERKKGVELYE